MSSTISTIPIKFFFILILSIIIVYGQSVHFAFVNYDDDELIYHNEAFLSQWQNIGTGFTSHAFIGAGGESIYYRPILVASFIVDYHIWKLDPFGYHLTNLLLHIITTLMVFLLLRKLFLNDLVALFGSLIFTLHPIQTESVGWIAGRNDILLGLFIVSMMFFYISGRRRSGPGKSDFILSLIFFMMAIFTKESAVFYLLLLPTYDILLHSTPDLKDKFFSVLSLKRYLPFISIVAGYFIIRWHIFGTLIGAERMYGADKPFSERIAHIPGIIAAHFQFIIAPFNLSVTHPLADVGWLRQPWYSAACIIVCLYGFFIWKLYKKNRTFCFGFLWFGVGLLPVLNIVPMPKPILEHRLYVPMLGAAIAIAYGIYRLNVRYLQYNHKIILLSVLSIVFALISYLRLPVWQNSIALFSDTVEKAPKDLHANYTLALAYYDAEKYPETISALEKYLDLAPGDLRAYRRLRETYYVIGQKQHVAAISKKMIELDPRTPLRYIEAGVIYEELNLPDSALLFYSQALSLDSSNAELYFRLGINEARLSQSGQAEQYYLKAIELHPGYTDAYIQLSTLYLQEKKHAFAINILERGLQFVQPSKNYLLILFNIYQLSGSVEKAQSLKQRYQF